MMMYLRTDPSLRAKYAQFSHSAPMVSLNQAVDRPAHGGVRSSA